MMYASLVKSKIWCTVGADYLSLHWMFNFVYSLDVVEFTNVIIIMVKKGRRTELDLLIKRLRRDSQLAHFNEID